MPLIAAGIGAAGSIGSGLIGGKSSKNAAKQQAAAQQQVLSRSDTQQENLSNLYNLQNSNLAPYLQAGTQGVNSLAAAFAPGGTLAQNFNAPTAAEAAATPGEQFMLNQGTQAVDRSGAAKGGLNSGSTLEALTQYGQGLASTSYQQAYNNALNTFQTNHNNTLSGLLALTGIGQNATGQYDQTAQAYGGQSLQNLGIQAGALTGQGNAQAQGTLGAGQAWTNTLGSLTNIASGNPGNIFGGGVGNVAPIQTSPGTYGTPAYSSAPSYIPPAPSVTPVPTAGYG
jgi:hypothetical protein